MDKRPALGRGLSALIPDVPEQRQAPQELDIDLLVPNAQQPRGQMDQTRLDELSQSIRAAGIIQPIVVRPLGDRFQIIAGERRWRAARMAGLLKVPIAVREVPSDESPALLEMALIENIQRENLNPIEEAKAYRRLSEEFHLTQDAIASAVGKDRATVANLLRLLKLPDDVRAHVASGVLSMGHARALLGLEAVVRQQEAASEVIRRKLSVRETEALVKRLEAGGKKRPARAPAGDIHTQAAEDRLRLLFGTRVRIVREGAAGRIEIAFGSEDELIRIYEQLTADAQP